MYILINNLDMKKLFFLIALSVLSLSCGISKELTKKNSKELIGIWEKEKVSGIKYFKYKNKWITETQMDSVITVVHNSVIKKISKDYPSN